VNSLVFPLLFFRHVLALARERGQVFVPIGCEAREHDRRWLARDVPLEPARGAGATPLPVLAVSLGRAARAPAPPPGTWLCGVLALGEHGERGEASGQVISPAATAPVPLDRLLLLGPGAHELPLVEATEPSAKSEARHDQTRSAVWSRTIGVLGEDAFHRLTSLRVAVVGCGRSGSLLAASLARIGVRALTLIDPDVIEPHNVGEMDLIDRRDVGLNKAEAVARRLVFPVDGGLVQVVAQPAQSGAALAAARAADLLCVAADRDAARLAAAVVQRLYHKFLIDVGTGIRADGRGRREMGVDVRLIVPGDRCLLCFGNLAEYRAAEEEIALGGAAVAPVPWNERRAGSLQSLNRLGVSLAMRLLEDLVSGGIERSTWEQADFGPTGAPTLQRREAPPASACELCQRAGLGDESGVGVHRDDEGERAPRGASVFS
jgi:hypothetical protein